MGQMTSPGSDSSLPDWRWREVLDALEMERFLEMAYLAGREPLPPPYVVPEGLGPIPAELVPRARDALIRTWGGL